MGDLFIADVGQNSREEVNFQPASFNGGANYGWDLREGTIETPSGGGALPGAIDPIYDYGHGLGPLQGYVVIGGYVYWGTLAPQLYGQYFFGDYLLGRIWSLDFDSTGAFEVLDWTDARQPDEGALTRSLHLARMRMENFTSQPKAAISSKSFRNRARSV